MEQSSGIVLAVAMPALLGIAAFLKTFRLSRRYALIRTPKAVRSDNQAMNVVS